MYQDDYGLQIVFVRGRPSVSVTFYFVFTHSMTLPTYSIVPLLRLPYAFISSLVKSLFLKNNYWLQYHEMSGTEQAGMELRAQFFHRIRPSSRSSAIKERASTASQYSRALYSLLRGEKMIRLIGS